MQSATERNANTGLLIMRLGIAASLLVYAIPRLLDSKTAWIQVGKEMRFLHADFPSQVVGLIILIIQILASVGLVSGYLFRICAVILAANFSLYFFNFMSVGYKTLPLYALALAIVCFGLLISGPGRYAVAVKIERK